MKIKSPDKNDFPDLIHFLNKNLRPNVNWSVNNEYPVAFSNFNINNIKFIEEEGNILSHALLKYLMIKTPAGLFKVAVIGSVVTGKEYQKKGLANKLIVELIEKATKDNCDICILWSDLDTFYTKHGFELCGSEEHLDLNSAKPELKIQDHLRLSINQKIDPQLILKLFSKHLVGSVRSLNEIESYLKIPNSNIYGLWDKNNLLAYAIQGRGLDLPNVVHEWGGDVPSLMQMFAQIINTGKNMQLITSSTARNLVNQINNNFNCAHTSRTLGYIKILNLQNIHFKVLRWARIQGEHHFQTFNQGDNVYLRYKSKNYQLPSKSALARLVWGPIDPQLIENLDSDLQQALLNVFPLPLWVWGWDIA